MARKRAAVDAAVADRGAGGSAPDPVAPGPVAPDPVAPDVEALDLEALAARLAALPFDLSGRAAPALRTERDRIARLLRGVALRTTEPRAPLLVVVGGGTGAGKSTTVNSLARQRVTQVSAVRPTTRVPTIVCAPDDRAWFDDARILPDLVRLDAEAAADREALRALRLVTTPALRTGSALLDTPDIDSVELGNHELAEEALDAADVWVWLATSRTYADEVGMTYLRLAQRRHVLTAVVITQVHPAEAAEVLADADRLLAEQGVRPDVRLHIPHAEVRDDQLPEPAVDDLRSWLDELAPTDRRVEVRRRALAGARAAIPAELTPLVEALDDEQRAADRLGRAVDDAYGSLPDRLDAELDTGLSLRAEVLDRWQRSVGGNETMLRVQTAAGQLGELIRARLGGAGNEPTKQVQLEAVSEVTRLTTQLLEHAHRRARASLEADGVGAEVLDRSPALRAGVPDREARARAAVTAWEEEVARLIEEVGAPRKAQARRRTTILNAVATSAILVLFTISGGLTGGEVGIAAGASATSQWLLIRMFGEQNLRDLLEAIRRDLHERVRVLADEERAPFDAAVAGSTAPAEAVATLRHVAEGRA
jgi:hypothetical protein